jgi:hypothetical protein
MILDGTSSSFFLYLFPYRSLKGKRDFDTENLRFWGRKKIFMHKMLQSMRESRLSEQ